jgi:WD40 repeat protein
MADLKIKSVIGFSGKVAGALNYSPCGNYIVYPLGSFVVLKNVKTDKECFLDGHSHEISCLSVSKDGKWIASGQINIIGVKVSSFFLCHGKSIVSIN